MALLCGGAPGACGASHAVELAARGPYSGASPTPGKLDLQVVPRCSPERSQQYCWTRSRCRCSAANPDQSPLVPYAVAPAPCRAQDMLAEKLVEVAFLEEKLALGHRTTCLLKDQAAAAETAAEAAAARRDADAREAAAALERRAAQAECDLAAARQDSSTWQRRASVLQLRLESAAEDGAMLRTRERGALEAARAAAAQAEAARRDAAAAGEAARAQHAAAERLAVQLRGAEARGRELDARLEAAAERAAGLERAARDAAALARTRLDAAEVRAACAAAHPSQTSCTCIRLRLQNVPLAAVCAAGRRYRPAHLFTDGQMAVHGAHGVAGPEPQPAAERACRRGSCGRWRPRSARWPRRRARRSAMRPWPRAWPRASARPPSATA